MSVAAELDDRRFELGVIAVAAVGGALGYVTWGLLGAVGTALVVGTLVYLHFAYPF